MKMDLHPKSKNLKLSILKADGLFDIFMDVNAIIPLTPFDYRELHNVALILIVTMR